MFEDDMMDGVFPNYKYEYFRKSLNQMIKRNKTMSKSMNVNFSGGKTKNLSEWIEVFK